MASTNVAPLLTLSLLLFGAVTAHGCAPNCPGSEPVNPTTPSFGYGHCPIDVLKLRVCASVLGGLVNAKIGETPYGCCSLIGGLVDIDAAVCLCTAIKANILGLDLDAAVDLSVILNGCGKSYPAGFSCH